MSTATSDNDALVSASGTTPRTSGSTTEAICGCWDEFREATLPNNCVKGVKWSPDGLCLLTASEDRQLRLFELPDAAAATAAAAGTGARHDAACCTKGLRRRLPDGELVRPRRVQVLPLA